MHRSAAFQRAIQEMRTLLPSLRQTLTDHLAREYQCNTAFHTAFKSGFDALAKQIQQVPDRPDPFHLFQQKANTTPAVTQENFSLVLIQQVLLGPMFRWAFPDVFARNVLTTQIEAALETVRNRAWHRQLLDGVFAPFEHEWRTCPTRQDKQHVLSQICEHFFKSFDPQQAHQFSVIYTPQEMIEFLCASVEEQITKSYGCSLSDPSVVMLDPCSGIGQFLVTMLWRIDEQAVHHKYANDLFGVEIMLMPYIVATLNVEHAFFDRTGRYEPFLGLRYADTLQLAQTPGQAGNVYSLFKK